MLRDALGVVACLLLLEATRAGDCNELVGNYSGRLVEHQTLAVRLTHAAAASCLCLYCRADVGCCRYDWLDM